MTPFQQMITAPTVDSLVGFDRDLAIAEGHAPATITAWEKLHTVYFGPTRFTAKQRDALQRAREGGFKLPQLILIEQRLTHIVDPAQRWQLRLQLLAKRGTYRATQTHATDIIPPKKQPAPQDNVRLTASRQGKRSLVLTGNERDVTDVEHALRGGLDPDRPEGPQMAARLMSMLRGDSDTADTSDTAPTVPAAAPRPVVLVPLDTHTKVLKGDTDEVTLTLSDGTTLTGAEYLTLLHTEDLEVAMFHPEQGAVNLYRTQRYANHKQRTLASLTSPGCPVPGCARPADFCQMHHVKEWADGGETNVDNLAPLCRYHNRINARAPGKRKAGRIIMHKGRPTWISHRGYPARNPRHGPGAMELLFGARH